MNNAQKIQANIGIDFDNLLAAADKRITVDVPVMFDEDGKPKAGFRIVGKNSPEYRATSHTVRAEGHVRSSMKKSAIDTTTEEGAGRLVDIVDGNQGRIAIAVIVETFGFQSGGADIQLSKAQIETALAKFPTWQNAVIAALENDADFLKV